MPLIKGCRSQGLERTLGTFWSMQCLIAAADWPKLSVGQEDA